MLAVQTLKRVTFEHLKNIYKSSLQMNHSHLGRHACGDTILNVIFCCVAVHCGPGQSMTNDSKSVMTQSTVHRTLRLVV